MDNIKTKWEINQVTIRVKKDGLTVNGKVISWDEIDAARQEVAPVEFKIPIVGVAK